MYETVEHGTIMGLTSTFITRVAIGKSNSRTHVTICRRKNLEPAWN